jgi:dihydroorotate dehydrogenase electron transfer subunit
MTLRASPTNRPQGIDLEALADGCCDRLAASYASRGMIASPTPVPLIEVQHEAGGVVTLWVQVPPEMVSDYNPGQYFMCWNPYDATGGMSRPNYHSEKPYSVGDVKIDRSGVDEGIAADTGGEGRALLGFTVKDLGRQSGELTRMKAGDWLAIRGPFGTSFPRMSSGDRLLLVSGGIGSTPMHMAARDGRRKLGDNLKIDAIMGFRNEAECHFISRMEALCDSLTITTDDGSSGTPGFPTGPLPNLLSGVGEGDREEGGSGRTVLLTCGPEPMMKAVLQMAVDAGVECYAAMERYLPCSVAMCGLCMVGDKLTCVDGPVMEGGWLLQQDDFGLSH